jgi:hypothetical protein
VVEDLVRVGVADPREEPRVGERPLQRVVLAPERRGERLRRRSDRVEAARVVLGERCLAPDDVERRALLRPRLRQEERAALEVERGEVDLAREPPAGLSPTEPSRDHQVQDEEQVALEREDDALSQAAEAGHDAPRGLRERRRRRPEEERRAEPDALEPPPCGLPLEAFHVHGDVRQLGHGPPRAPSGRQFPAGDAIDAAGTIFPGSSSRTRNSVIAV